MMPAKSARFLPAMMRSVEVRCFVADQALISAEMFLRGSSVPTKRKNRRVEGDGGRG